MAKNEQQTTNDIQHPTKRVAFYSYLRFIYSSVLFINNISAYESIFFPHTSAISPSIPSRYEARNELCPRKNPIFHISNSYLRTRLFSRSASASSSSALSAFQMVRQMPSSQFMERICSPARLNFFKRPFSSPFR